MRSMERRRDEQSNRISMTETDGLAKINEQQAQLC
jgi:hypothetical protein